MIVGPAVRASVRHLTGDNLTTQQIQRVWQALDRQVQRRDHHDQFTPPIGFTTLAIQAVITGTAALLAAITTAWLISTSAPIGWRLAGSLALIAGPAPLRRLGPARYPALGWQAGAGGCLLIVPIAIILATFN